MTIEEYAEKMSAEGKTEEQRKFVSDFILRTFAKWCSPEGRAKAAKARAEIAAGEYRVLNAGESHG